MSLTSDEIDRKLSEACGLFPTSAQALWDYWWEKVWTYPNPTPEQQAILGRFFLKLGLHRQWLLKTLEWLNQGTPIHGGVWIECLQKLGVGQHDSDWQQLAKITQGLPVLWIVNLNELPSLEPWRQQTQQARLQLERKLEEDLDFVLNQLENFISQGIWDQAESFWHQLAAKMPNHPKLGTWLGQIKLGKGQHHLESEPEKLDIKTYIHDSPVKNDPPVTSSMAPWLIHPFLPQSPRQALWRSWLFTMAQDFERARLCLRMFPEVLEKPEAYWLYLELLIKDRHFLEALDFLENHVQKRIDPFMRAENWALYNTLKAECLAGMGQRQMALKILQDVLPLVDDHHPAHRLWWKLKSAA